MKTNAIIRIILLSLAIVILTTILVGALFFRCSPFGPKLTDYPEPTAGQMNQFEFSTDIKRIEIEWVAGDIMIDAQEGLNTISVFESMSNDVTETMFCTTSGDTLKIQFCEDSIKFPTFGINYNFSKDLHITVPSSWHCDELSIDAASSNVTINGLNINEIDFDGASGVMSIVDCNVWDLDIDTASGDVEFNGTLENLDFDAVSASFHGTVHNCPSQIEMNSLSGKLTLYLPSDCGFTVTNDSLSNKINSDFEVSFSHNAIVHGDGSCKIDVSGLADDVTINKHASETAPCNEPNCTDTTHNHQSLHSEPQHH